MDDFQKMLNDKVDNFFEEEQKKGGNFNKDRLPNLQVNETARVRLMPPAEFFKQESDAFSRAFFYHYFKPAAGGKKQFITCPKITGDWEAPCGFCDYAQDMWDAQDKNEYKNYHRYKNFLYVGVLLSYETGSKERDALFKNYLNKVCYVVIPKTVDAIIREEMKESKGLIYNPFDGCDLIIKVTDKGDHNSYETTKFSRETSGICEAKEDILKIVEEVKENFSLDAYCTRELDVAKVQRLAIEEKIVKPSGEPQEKKEAVPEDVFSGGKKDEETPPEKNEAPNSEEKAEETKEKEPENETDSSASNIEAEINALFGDK